MPVIVRKPTFMNGGQVSAGNSVPFVYGFNIETPTFETSFSVNSQMSRIGFAIFDNTGTKMFAANYNNVTCYQYTLTTPWDLTTASYANLSQNVTDGLDGWFSADGLTLWTAANGRINEYSCSTPFDDLGNYTLVQSVSGFTGLSNFRFNSDGTVLYGTARFADRVPVYEYPLSTPYDISTATTTATDFIDLLGYYDAGIEFNHDGTKFFVIEAGNDRVRQYSLSTPYDPMTAVYDNIELSAGTGGPTGLFFKPDGNKLYICDNTTNAVRQYDTSAA